MKIQNIDIQKSQKENNIQLCPLCDKVMEISKKCCHLTWQRCMTIFWSFCRNKYTKNHMNPLNGQMCSSLQKVQKGSLVSRMPSVSTNACHRILLLLLLLLVSPIFWMIILPYVWYRNIINTTTSYRNKKQINWKYNLWGIIVAIWVIMLFPITWMATIVFLFCLFFSMSKKKKRSAVYAK